VLSEIQSKYATSPTRGRGRDAVVEFDLESDRIRLLCALDDERAKLLRACGRNQGRKYIAAQEKAAAAAERTVVEAKTPEEARKAMEVLESRPNPARVGLPREEVLEDPFWVKVRDSVLTAQERAAVAAAPKMAAGAVREPRVELALARLDFLFHLDAKQMDTLRQLAELVVAKDQESMLVAPLDVFRSFGMHAGSKPVGQRTARRCLEDVLDPLQFEVLRDTAGL
jgi:hypothetical protein